MKHIFYFLFVICFLSACKPGAETKDKTIIKKILIPDSLGKTVYYELNFYSSPHSRKDSTYTFYSNNELFLKSIFRNDSLIKEYQYVNGKLKYLHDYDTKIVYEYSKEGNILLINNNKDSTNTIFYHNSKRIKTFMKFNYFEAYYYNTYDSINQTLQSCFRHPYEDFEVVGDKLYVTPYFESKNEDISKYTFTIILLDKDGFVKNTYFQKGKNPKFVLPYAPHMKWIKVVCDSIGCFSLPFTYTN